MDKQLELTEQQIAIIHKIPLFREVSPELKGKLLDKLDYFLTPLKKGDVIIKQGTSCVCLQAKVHQSHLSVLYFKPS